MSEAIRVVVVDDSPTQRAHLVRLLEHDGDIEVVSEAANRADAIEAVLRARPDVVTMDLEMPGTLPGDELAGIRAVRTIMAISPTPILVVSAHTPTAGSTAAIESLAAGAADVRPRPQDADDPEGTDIRERVRVLSGVTVVTRRLASRTAKRTGAEPAIVALGASTGGPPALGTVVAELRGIQAPVLVVQHIHPDFVMSFSGWLERETGLSTHVAQSGDEPLPGHVYVAPARRHLRVSQHGHLSLSEQPESLHRPSVDELFESLASSDGTSVVAALLTGMGDDGARGLAAIREAGGITVAQDEGTSAVYGMPRAAVRLDEGHDVLPLERIGPSIRLAVAGEGG